MHQLDLSLFQFVNAWCGNWTLDRIALFEENHNLYKGGLFMLAYCWFWFASAPERRDANRHRIVAAILGTLVALIVNRAMATGLPFRIRPMSDLGSGYHPPFLPIIANMEDWNSFPSDTATFFFALAFGLFRLSRPLGAIMMAYSAVWICLPRLYLGVHFPSDLVAGAVLGIVVVYAAMAAMNARGGALGQRVMTLLRRAEQDYPQYFYVTALAVTFEMMSLFDDVRDLARGGVRFLRLTGYIAVGEGAALFLVGGAVLVLALGAWITVGLRRRTVGRTAGNNRRPDSGFSIDWVQPGIGSLDRAIPTSPPPSLTDPVVSREYCKADLAGVAELAQ